MCPVALLFCLVCVTSNDPSVTRVSYMSGCVAIECICRVSRYVGARSIYPLTSLISSTFKYIFIKGRAFSPICVALDQCNCMNLLKYS